jgi:hypothetical protein
MWLKIAEEVELASVDLMNVEQTSEVIAQFRPDIIFCAATLQRWGAINVLPKRISEQLYQAQIGPWLPLHLMLVYKLMLAVQQTGLDIKVINATYPDCKCDYCMAAKFENYLTEYQHCLFLLLIM